MILRVISVLHLLPGFRVLIFAIGVISNYPVVISLLRPSKIHLPFLSQPLPIVRCLFVFSASNKRILELQFAVVNLAKQDYIPVLYQSLVIMHVVSNPMSLKFNLFRRCTVHSHSFKDESMHCLYDSLPPNFCC